jgi:DNA ligase (NAD+)
VAHVVASHFGSLDAIAKASTDELSSVNEIGEVIAQSIHDFFHSEAGSAAIAALKSAGIDPKFAKPQAAEGELLLAGKNGRRHRHAGEIRPQGNRRSDRETGRKSIRQHQQKTSFLVAGADAGSKLAKAKELGVEVISKKNSSSG